MKKMKRKWLVGITTLILMGMVFSVPALSAEEQTCTPAEKKQLQLRKLSETWKRTQEFRQKEKQFASRRQQLGAKQREKLNKLRLRFQEETLELRTGLKEKQLRLRELLSETPVDLAKIETLVDEMSLIEADIKKKAIHSWIELKDIFTEEQQIKNSPSPFILFR